MSDEKRIKLMQEKDHLENDNAALRQEIEALKLREEKYLYTIKEQGSELEKLRNLARVTEQHFIENGPGWQVERCIGCGKCDYVLLGNTLEKALASSK